MKKYKIVNKNRFFIFVTAFSFIVLIIFTLLISSFKAHGTILEGEYTEFLVRPGDTIWNIALKYKSNNSDVRDMVYKIKDFNNMDNSYIFVGDIIKIPID